MICWYKWANKKPAENEMILGYNKKWVGMNNNHGYTGIRYGFLNSHGDFVWANCDGEDEEFDSLRKHLFDAFPNMPYPEYRDCLFPTHWTYLPDFTKNLT